MVGHVRIYLSGVITTVLCAACGCQLYNSGREIRSEEQMLPVSFENDRAQELFLKAVQTTYGEEMNVKRIGHPRFSLYSYSETVAWNANCNDHIRKMDTDGDLLIMEREARAHYESLAATNSETRGSPPSQKR
jgi:hypothetical protein